MAKKTSSKDTKGFRKYVEYLGKTGTFYKDSKDKKGTEATLVAIGKDGIYGKTKANPFPQLFNRADFGATGTFKCSCGKEYKVIPVDGSKSSKKSKDKDSYGKFSGKNAGKKAKAFIKLWKEIDDGLDVEDDDDYAKGVELAKKMFS